MATSASTAFVTEFKTYAKIDYTDSSATDILNAAIEYAEEKTGKSFIESSAYYCQVVKMIAQTWYDHRGAVTTENIKELPLPTNVEAMIAQIQMSSTLTISEG